MCLFTNSFLLQREFFNAAVYFKKPVITMLTGADSALTYEAMSDTDLVNMADTFFRSLIPDSEASSAAKVSDFLVTRWQADPNALGSYSYLPVGASAADRTTMCKHMGDGVFWAGEHCDVDHPATGKLKENTAEELIFEKVAF